jgi:hypothetical protein
MARRGRRQVDPSAPPRDRACSLLIRKGNPLPKRCNNACPVPASAANDLKWRQAFEGLFPFAVFQLDCKRKGRHCKSHDFAWVPCPRLCVGMPWHADGAVEDMPTPSRGHATRPLPSPNPTACCRSGTDDKSSAWGSAAQLNVPRARLNSSRISDLPSQFETLYQDVGQLLAGPYIVGECDQTRPPFCYVALMRVWRTVAGRFHPILEGLAQRVSRLRSVARLMCGGAHGPVVNEHGQDAVHAHAVEA